MVHVGKKLSGLVLATAAALVCSAPVQAAEITLKLGSVDNQASQMTEAVKATKDEKR